MTFNAVNLRVYGHGRVCDRVYANGHVYVHVCDHDHVCVPVKLHLND